MLRPLNDELEREERLMTVADKSSSKHRIVNVRGMTVAELTELLQPKPHPMVNVVF